MNAAQLAESLKLLFAELVDGPPSGACFILNPKDPGLLRSLDLLSAAAASAPTKTGSSVAAHVDHLRFGFELMNKWLAGDAHAFDGADFQASWRKTSVNDAQWKQLRLDLRDEAHRWLDTNSRPREMNATELSAVIGSVAHLAYHFGAIRQIDSAARGPSA